MKDRMSFVNGGVNQSKNDIDTAKLNHIKHILPVSELLSTRLPVGRFLHFEPEMMDAPVHLVNAL